MDSQYKGCAFCPWAQCLNTMDAQLTQDEQQGPPSGPPPNYIPNESPGTFAVDPGAISFCLYKFTYIWLRNGQSFWAYLIFVGRESVAGWRYQRGRWTYFGVDLREIRSFQC